MPGVIIPTLGDMKVNVTAFGHMKLFTSVDAATAELQRLRSKEVEKTENPIKYHLAYTTDYRIGIAIETNNTKGHDKNVFFIPGDRVPPGVKVFGVKDGFQMKGTKCRSLS